MYILKNILLKKKTFKFINLTQLLISFLKKKFNIFIFRIDIFFEFLFLEFKNFLFLSLSLH